MSSAGILFLRIPHFLAILTAVSVASEPEVPDTTLSYPKRVQSLWASGPQLAV